MSEPSGLRGPQKSGVAAPWGALVGVLLGTCPALGQAASEPEDSAVAYYPAQALAEGLDGSATIKCQRDQHSAYVGCQIVSEHPADQGFGAAAVALATHVPPRETLTLTPEDMALELPFHFTFKAKPTSVRPDLFHQPISNPRWLTIPGPDDMAAAYPRFAAKSGLEGRTVMTCRADEKGRMTACQIDSESPAGAGFGEAALKVSRDFSMTTFTDDGFPTLGYKITIPIRWSAPR